MFQPALHVLQRAASLPGMSNWQDASGQLPQIIFQQPTLQPQQPTMQPQSQDVSLSQLLQSIPTPSSVQPVNLSMGSTSSTPVPPISTSSPVTTVATSGTGSVVGAALREANIALEELDD